LVEKRKKKLKYTLPSVNDRHSVQPYFAECQTGNTRQRTFAEWCWGHSAMYILKKIKNPLFWALGKAYFFKKIKNSLPSARSRAPGKVVLHVT
jgi:hypothetical protein